MCTAEEEDAVLIAEAAEVDRTEGEGLGASNAGTGRNAERQSSWLHSILHTYCTIDDFKVVHPVPLFLPILLNGGQDSAEEFQMLIGFSCGKSHECFHNGW
jgi:hypothetical protein